MKRERIALSLAALALLSLMAWLLYGSAIRAPFIFDGQASIHESGSIFRLWPLVNLSLALNYHFGQFGQSLPSEVVPPPPAR